MKKRWMGLVACLVIGQVQAARFDCAKATTKVEKLICADTELSKLDEALATVYAEALQSIDPANLKAEQKAWLKVRNRCVDEACIQQNYRNRLTALQATNTTPPATGHDRAKTTPESSKRQPQEAERFMLVLGKETPLCRDYKRFLEQKIKVDRVPPMCERVFGKDFPEFSQAAWREIEPEDHPELAVQVYRYLHYWPWDSYPGAVEAIKESAFKEQLAGMKMLRKSRQVSMWLAEADIDNDGKAETLIKVSDGIQVADGWACDEYGRGGSRPPIWTVPVMVLDNTGKGIDTVRSEWILGVTIIPEFDVFGTKIRGMHALDSQAFDIFTYGPTAYFDRWENTWPIPTGKKHNPRYAGLSVYRVDHGNTAPLCRIKFKK